MGKIYRIAVAGQPPGPNNTMHPQKRRRLENEMAEVVAWEAKQQAPARPHKRARVTITLVAHTGPLRDEDNAYACTKRALLDPLKGILIEDDSPKHIELEIRQERGKKRQSIIDVEELDC